MVLSLRIARALRLFSVIFLSYALHLLLVRLTRRRVLGEDGREALRSPAWIVARRARVDERNARRLREGMLRLRGVYIKLGQVLSIMGGFLPRVYTRELEALQDQVPPQPFASVERTFRRSLGRHPDEIFRTLDRIPLAAASLGQVHRAELADGRRVAVKVLYPGIRDVIRADMRALRVALRLYQRLVPVRHLMRVHESLVDLLQRETDYLHEAACMERMAGNAAGEPDLDFPQVVHELTTRDILTMTFLEGIKVTHLEELRAAGIEPRRVAVRLVQMFYKQVFVDRYVHADPHPGNFLVRPGPRLSVLDFGAVCEIRPELVEGMTEILRALPAQDDAAAVRGFRRMGFVAPGGNERLLERTVRLYFTRLLRIKNRTAAALMQARPEQLDELVDPGVERGELRELLRSVEYPEGWFYVERACVLLFWLVAQIDPTLDTLEVGIPHVLPLLAAQAG